MFQNMHDGHLVSVQSKREGLLLKLASMENHKHCYSFKEISVSTDTSYSTKTIAGFRRVSEADAHFWNSYATLWFLPCRSWHLPPRECYED